MKWAKAFPIDCKLAYPLPEQSTCFCFGSPARFTRLYTPAAFWSIVGDRPPISSFKDTPIASHDEPHLLIVSC